MNRIISWFFDENRDVQAAHDEDIRIDQKRLDRSLSRLVISAHRQVAATNEFVRTVEKFVDDLRA